MPAASEFDPGPTEGELTRLDCYLLFRGDRIVELRFFWEPTAQQLAAAGVLLAS